MKVTYPTSKDVYITEYKGNLEPTYSKTMQKNVVGNLCPDCGAYQGNYFVWDNGLVDHSYDLGNYVVGDFEIGVKCLVCGKGLEEFASDDHLSKLHAMINFYGEYLYV
jgi:hypothetical protein